MDSTIALALIAKAKLVFEREDTFLSFPLNTISYTREQLSFMSGGDLTNDRLSSLSEFSRLVNQIPSGVMWPPTEERYLWDVYDDVLKSARLASSTRTPEEESDYQKAFRFLHETKEGGLLEDTPPVKAYSRYKDAWYVAQQDYNNKKIEAEFSTDSGVKQRWRDIDEPTLREKITSLEGLWMTNGYKVQVEESRRIEAALGSKSPFQIWSRWAASFNKEIDSLTDTNNQHFVPSGFSPSNTLDVDTWLKFTLTSDEADALIKQAPKELLTALGQNPLSIDIESLSFEYTSVAVTRAWLEPDVFKARFWRFYENSKLLSDGKTPPSGICPSYVAALVFARNPIINLKPNSTKNDAVLNQLRSTKALSLGFLKVAPLTTGTTLQKTTVLMSHPVDVAHPVNVESVIVSHPLNVGSVTMAHPVNIRPIAMVHPVNVGPITVAHPVIRMRNAAFTRITPENTTSPPQPAQPTGNDEDIYIMAFICKRLPQCPNPDPNLQW